MKKSTPSTMGKSTTTKSNLIKKKDLWMTLLIVAASFLPYIHDIGNLREYEGFSGFKSLRTGVYFVSMFMMNLIGWILAFIFSRGKSYRIAFLIPIFMLSYQLAVYLFDARQTTTNEFTTKVIVNLSFAICIIASYFLLKNKRASDE